MREKEEQLRAERENEKFRKLPKKEQEKLMKINAFQQRKQWEKEQKQELLGKNI